MVRLLVVGVALVTGSTSVLGHETNTAATGGGLTFGVVLALTVTLGVLGGFVVLRWQRSGHRQVSTHGVALLLVVLGCWASVLAVGQAVTVALAGVTAGAVLTWSLRNRVAGGHHACDQAALGAVVTHRVVEGGLLATLYAANAALGVGTALLLAGHAAVETGAVVGLWSTSRWRWAVVGVVQAGFVAGALGGAVVVAPLGPTAEGVVLAVLGGALIAAGLATESRRNHPTLVRA